MAWLDDGMPDTAPDRVADKVTGRASRACVAAALLVLSAGERELLLLIAWSELSYEEAAKVLGVPIGTVRSRLSRARQSSADGWVRPPEPGISPQEASATNTRLRQVQDRGEHSLVVHRRRPPPCRRNGAGGISGAENSHSESKAHFASTLSSTKEDRRGWHSTLAALTHKSVWTMGDRQGPSSMRPGPKLSAGLAVLRDYTMSMKHYGDEVAFVSDLADADRAWQVASWLAELCEDVLVGGFVLHRFEQFTRAEVRTWWIDGDCRLIGPHPDTPDELPPDEPDLAELAPLVAALDLPFVDRGPRPAIRRRVAGHRTRRRARSATDHPPSHRKH